MRRFLIAATAFLALVSIPLEAKSRTFKAKNVVVLVIDGPRQSEMWGDPSRRYIPHLAKELAPQGTLMTGFRNNGPTYTAAGHTALCTGFYQEIDNSSGKQLPSHASMFQYYLKATGQLKEKAWIITSKDKLAILGNTTELGWHWLYTPSVWCGVGGKGPGAGYAEDSETMATVKEVLKRHHPHLVLINLKQPDANGHGGKWEKYVQALRESDTYAAQLWTFLQSDSQYRNQTAYFITHDHGRHLNGVADGFLNHGCGCEGCRGIALLALGPDFKRGAVIKTGGEQIDLPVTVAAILGFEMPYLKGRVLTELFR